MHNQEHWAPHGNGRDISIDKMGQVSLTRHLNPDKTMITTEGRFVGVFEAWLQHVRLWQGEPDDLSTTMMRQGLAAAVLVMANRPPYETLAWTINIRRPPMNIFMAGEGERGHITGRVFSQNVETYETNRFYVEIAKPGREPHLTSLNVEGLDVLLHFERYFAVSEQCPARFFERDSDRFIMVLSLPGVDNDVFASLDEDGAEGLLLDSDILQTRHFTFECGCNPERMLRTVHALFNEKPEELFRGDARVETSCPRCGRRWWIAREVFDAFGEPKG